MGISPMEFLVRELKRRRVAAGLTQTALGERVYCSDTQISAIETGSKPVTHKHLELVDTALQTGGFFVRLWEELVKDSDAPMWLRQWIEIEREAWVLRSFQLAVLPGLLQTETYARALLGSGFLGVNKVAQQVTARMDRQAILARDEPPYLTMVIDEHALRRPVGGREVMREQLAHLLKVGEQSHVQIQIVPSDVGAYFGLGGAFALATLPDATEFVYLDNPLKGQVVDGTAEVLWMRRTWDDIRGSALSLPQSRDLITKVVEELWT